MIIKISTEATLSKLDSCTGKTSIKTADLPKLKFRPCHLAPVFEQVNVTVPQFSHL